MSDAPLIIPPGAEDLEQENTPPAGSVSPVNCTACLFFREVTKHPTPQGSCHRIPPIPVVVGHRPHPFGAKHGTQPVAMSFWPSVGISDWCGEFQPKKKPEADQ